MAKILLIEDDSALNMGLTFELEEEGCQVYSCKETRRRDETIRR